MCVCMCVCVCNHYYYNNLSDIIVKILVLYVYVCAFIYNIYMHVCMYVCVCRYDRYSGLYSHSFLKFRNSFWFRMIWGWGPLSRLEHGVHYNTYSQIIYIYYTYIINQSSKQASKQAIHPSIHPSIFLSLSLSLSLSRSLCNMHPKPTTCCTTLAIFERKCIELESSCLQQEGFMPHPWRMGTKDD